MATVTCRTPDCSNAGIAIDFPTTFDSEDGAQPLDAVVCGVCGQEITDIENDERGQEVTPR